MGIEAPMDPHTHIYTVPVEHGQAASIDKDVVVCPGFVMAVTFDLIQLTGGRTCTAMGKCAKAHCTVGRNPMRMSLSLPGWPECPGFAVVPPNSIAYIHTRRCLPSS